MTVTSVHRRRRQVITTPSAPTVRVAIYTRKSVDKGGGSPFGSVEAQRDAVASYVASQREKGWVALLDRYDDGNNTGANIDRPAFQRLLADVQGGKLDIIGVYRLDRLSRSQADFTRLLELLDQHGVRFFSVSESFDTSTPHGRFAMGLLMQVAQLEREVTAERVRDKVGAARRRGLWTGGRPVIGYDPVEGKLHVNAAEEAIVRDVYALFLKTESLIDVVHELTRLGIANKSWTNKAGNPVVGAPFDKSSLRALLTNPLYVGKIRQGDELHTGIHEALVDTATWDAAQAILTRNARHRRPVRAWNSILGGLLRCGCGAAMSHHSTRQHSRTYRSYVCQRIIKNSAAACPGSRVPARDLEAAVVEKIRVIGNDRKLQRETIAAARVGSPPIDEGELRQALETFAVWDTLFVPEQGRILHLVIEQVVYTASEHEVRITFRDSGIKALAKENAA